MKGRQRRDGKAVLRAFYAALMSTEVPGMRADDSDYEAYADAYQERANEDMDGDADWELFEQLWEDRHNSNEDMAELLAEVKGVAYDEALAWIEGRGSP